jgi:hypothetical protein
MSEVPLYTDTDYRATLRNNKREQRGAAPVEVRAGREESGWQET